MGLRAEERRPARNRHRPRAHDRYQPARRSCLSVIAARGAGRALARVQLRYADAPGRRLAACPRRGSDRCGRADPRRGEEPVDHHRGCRPRSRRGAGARRLRRALRYPGHRTSPAASVAAFRSPLPSRLQPGGIARRGRCDPRHRLRRAVDAESRQASARLQDHPYRRRPAVQPLSDPRVSLRRRDHRRDPALLAAARRGAGAARRRTGDRRAAAASRRAARDDAGGLEEAARRGPGDTADPSGLGQRLSRRGARSRLGDRQRIHAPARALPVDPAGRLFRVEPGGGARLGRRCRARRQARRARPAGHRGPRRRLVSLRQPGRGAPRVGPASAAGAVRRRQQRDVGRGAPRHPRHVPQGRSLAQQPPALYRSRRTAGLRAGLRRFGRLWRAPSTRSPAR
jgi:hypothetical protein